MVTLSIICSHTIQANIKPLASVVVQWIKPLPETPASHIDVPGASLATMPF